MPLRGNDLGHRDGSGAAADGRTALPTPENGQNRPFRGMERAVLRAELPPPARPHGRPRKEPEDSDGAEKREAGKGGNTTFSTGKQTAAYTIARLKRDAAKDEAARWGPEDGARW